MEDGMVMAQVGRHRLAASVLGEGAPAVVIEPAFGGAADDWQAIALTVARVTTVVTYDRAPYGESSDARDARTPWDIAADLDGLLRELEVTGPLVLVGHSAGGIYVRAFAAAHLDRVAGMVLVESSHEGQRSVLDPLRSPRRRLQDLMVIPSIIGASRRARRGGGRRAIIREWRAFRRLTEAVRSLAPGDLGDRPLAVLTCAPANPAAPDRCYQAWRGLHRDLAGLSENSGHFLSGSSAHHLNLADPDLVAAAISDVVRCARSGGRVGETSAVLAGGDHDFAASDAD